MEPKKDYIHIGNCPRCGAPLLMKETTWKTGEPLFDETYNYFYMPGVIYTCKCHVPPIPYTITWSPSTKPIDIPSTWSSPDDISDRDGYSEFHIIGDVYDSAGNPIK